MWSGASPRYGYWIVFQELLLSLYIRMEDETGTPSGGASASRFFLFSGRKTKTMYMCKNCEESVRCERNMNASLHFQSEAEHPVPE